MVVNTGMNKIIVLFVNANNTFCTSYKSEIHLVLKHEAGELSENTQKNKFTLYYLKIMNKLQEQL